MPAPLDDRLRLLDHVYQVYDQFAGSLSPVCRPGCSHCCTRNVTVTTLETYRLAAAVTDRYEGLPASVRRASEGMRFRPGVTINALAALCIQEAPVPEEEADPSWGPCPLLLDDHCPFYDLRPFGCRCLVSTVPCKETGYAEVEPFVITVNNVFQQYIEHIDADGLTGNLVDLLGFFASGRAGRDYETGFFRGRPDGGGLLLSNRTIPALMVPPKHRGRIRPILEALGKFS